MNLIDRILGRPYLPGEAPPTLDPVPMLGVFVTPDPYEASYYRRVLLDLHNLARGGKPLALSDHLCAAAMEHAGSMSRRRKLDHEGFSTRSQRWSFRAENCAWGHREPEMVWYHKTAGWWTSQAHRANALNPAYTICGFGRAGDWWCAVYGA